MSAALLNNARRFSKEAVAIDPPTSLAGAPCYATQGHCQDFPSLMDVVISHCSFKAHVSAY